MNKLQATSLRRIQATENNSTHKIKMSSFKLKVTIGREMEVSNQKVFLNRFKDIRSLKFLYKKGMNVKLLINNLRLQLSTFFKVFFSFSLGQAPENNLLKKNFLQKEWKGRRIRKKLDFMN